MRFGINSFLFVSPFVTQSTRLFSKFKKWGFDTVELPIEAPEHIDSLKVKKALDRAGLVCGSVCACMGPGRDFRGSAKDQREAMKYCKALIDHMVNLDCPSLFGPVYSVVGKADAVEPKDQKKEFALVVKNLKILAAYAEKKGVQICVEPLNRFETDFLNTCEKGLRLIKAVGSPAVKLQRRAANRLDEAQPLLTRIEKGSLKTGERLDTDLHPLFLGVGREDLEVLHH